MTGRKLKTKTKAPTETRRLGYARASTYGQTINAQLAQLRAEGCTRIYREKMGGFHPRGGGGAAMADRLEFEIDVELETGLITGHAGVPGLIGACWS